MGCHIKGNKPKPWPLGKPKARGLATDGLACCHPLLALSFLPVKGWGCYCQPLGTSSLHSGSTRDIVRFGGADEGTEGARVSAKARLQSPAPEWHWWDIPVGGKVYTGCPSSLSPKASSGLHPWSLMAPPASLDRHLAQNPFICDCNLKWLADFLRTNPIETSGARCASPRRLANKRIGQIKSKKFRCSGSQLPAHMPSGGLSTQ